MKNNKLILISQHRFRSEKNNIFTEKVLKRMKSERKII